MKQATLETRSIVVAAYFAGTASRKHLADIFGYHVETVSRWIRCIREGRLAPLPRGHGISVFNADGLVQLAAFIESNPDATLAEMRTHFAKSCSLAAMHKIAQKIGYLVYQ